MIQLTAALIARALYLADVLEGQPTPTTCETHGIESCPAPCCEGHPIGCVCVECEEAQMQREVARQKGGDRA